MTGVQGYVPPVAPAADPVAAPGGGAPGPYSVYADDERDGTRARGDGPPQIGAPASMAEAYNTGTYLDNPFARVASSMLPTPFNLVAPAIRAFTTGPFASDEQAQFNSTVETAGNPTPGDRVPGDPNSGPTGGIAGATVGLNQADETDDFGEGPGAHSTATAEQQQTQSNFADANEAYSGEQMTGGEGGEGAPDSGGAAASGGSRGESGVDSGDESDNMGGDGGTGGGGDSGDGGSSSGGGPSGGDTDGSSFHAGGPVPESRVPGVAGADTRETLQEGEYVVNRDAAQAIGPEALGQINAAGGPGAAPGGPGGPTGGPGGGAVEQSVIAYMTMTPPEQEAFISTIEAIQASTPPGQGPAGGPEAAAPPLPGGGAPAMPGGAPVGATPGAQPPNPQAGAGIPIPGDPRGPKSSLAGQQFRR